jgi:hypothetical protein
MKLSELLDTLAEAQAEAGEENDPEVRLAFQPNWPFQYEVGDVRAVDLGAPDPEGLPECESCEGEGCETCEGTGHALDNGNHVEEFVIFLAEGGQHYDAHYDAPYLPGVAATELGWR